MRAGVLWMLMVFVSDAEVPRCSVERIITASNLSEVSVSCPSGHADDLELKYQLLFNDSCIIQVHVTKLSGSAETLFSGQFEVTVNSSGEYKCRREVVYPPPFRGDCVITAVTVAEKQAAINDTVPAANQSCPVRFIPEVVMWAGCGLLLVYSLSVTCIVLWRKRTRDEDETNVYVNARPPVKTIS